MKILLISQYYWPENSRVTDISEELQKAGYRVTVLTGLPNYPQGFIYEEYKNGKNRFQIHNDVEIIRSKIIARRHSTLFRFLNYYSFPFFAIKIAKKLNNDFDVVLAMEESPIMLVKPAIVYAKKHNKSLLMYEMDLWPESLLAGGISNKSFLYKHYKKVSARIYSKCDKILVSSKDHIHYIRSLPNCEKTDIEYLPQYAESVFDNIGNAGVNDDYLNIMFAGNIGKAQKVNFLLEAANLLKSKDNIKFHIVGNGSEYKNCVQLAEKYHLDNVKFYGQLPLEAMPKLYAKADAMFVSLENKGYANMTIPGKVQSYLAAGKPIIGCINGSTKDLIIENEIGECCAAEDFVSLAEIIKNLTKEKLGKYSINSKCLYEREFTKERFMKKLINELEKLAK